MARQARKIRKGHRRRKQPEAEEIDQEVVETLLRALAAGEVGTAESMLNKLRDGGRHSFPHIVRKLGRMGPQEQQLLLKAVKKVGSPEMVRELSKGLADSEISLGVRVEIIALLRDAGFVPDPQLASAVEQAHAVVEQAAAVLEQETRGPALSALLAELAALPKSTARMALQELARRDVSGAIALFRALVRNQPDDIDYAQLTVQALDGIVHEEAARYLAELLNESKARILQRFIRRALYRLKLCGIQTTPPSTSEERVSVLTAPEFRFVSAHASHIDGDGNRSFYLAKAKSFGGVHLIFISINDRKGVLDFAVAQLKKGEYEDIRRKIANEGLFVDIEPSYALAQVKAAAIKNRSTGTALPPEYVMNHNLLGEPEAELTRAEPLIFSELDAEEIAALPARLNDSAHLFEREEFGDWKFTADEVAPYLYEYEEAEESRIVVSEALKQERLEKVYGKAAAGLMAGELRSIYKARLEEMAHVLRHKGEQGWGNAALAAATALEDESPVPPEKNPFVLELVKRGLAAATKETKDRLIVKPDEGGGSIR